MSICKKNQNLQQAVFNVLGLLEENPFNSSLKSHKADAKQFGKRWTSAITKDLRVIWDFQEGKINVIDILNIGGHSGKNSVYK